ncbi:hypothetical protein [Halomicronema sp. CCY15110]|uniref:hypothetical protein n=1 Tax=Halomicronema sp. CCY15110 TaxID=2767773 RepID=UPI00194FF416|nr:hypothetical protein [Halomicronema sp. CCY15110]
MTGQESESKAEISKESPNRADNKQGSFGGLPIPLLDSLTKGWTASSVAVISLLSAIGGALVTGFFEVRGQDLQSKAQFQLGRQKFEFSLIRSALEEENPEEDAQSPEEESPEPEEDGQNQDELGNTSRSINAINTIEVNGSENSSGSALDSDEEHNQKAADTLLFYCTIGIIQSLDCEAIRLWIKDKQNLPTFPREPENTGNLPPVGNSNNSFPYPFGSICYFVLTPVKVYGSPSFDAPLDVSFTEADFAYASYPFERVVVNNGQNAFVLIDFYGGNQGWVPFFSEDLSTKILEQYPPDDCLL